MRLIFFNALGFSGTGAITWGISREVSGSAFDGFGGCAILAIETALILKMIVHLCLQSALSVLLDQRSENSCFSHPIFAITECLNGYFHVQVRLRHVSFPSCDHLRLYDMTQNFEHYPINASTRKNPAKKSSYSSSRIFVPFGPLVLDALIDHAQAPSPKIFHAIRTYRR